MANKDIQVRRDSKSADIDSVIPEMNQMMERFFNNPFSSLLNELPTLNRRSFGEIKETDQGYILYADVPGIPKEDIDVNINGNMLTIQAEHKEEAGEADSEKGYRRQYRSFQQSFSLPTNVDTEQIEAHCENGVLEILLPKTGASPAKKVEIQSGKGGFWNRLMGKDESKEKAAVNKQGSTKH